MLSDEIFCEGVVDHILSDGTKQLAIRCLLMTRRPAPPEIRTAARFFGNGTDWRAVSILAGWLPTKEGDWVAEDDPSFSWDSVRPASITPRAKGPGSEWWNQELAALAFVRTIKAK